MAADRRLALYATFPDRYAHLQALICDGSEIRDIPINDLDLWATHIDTLGDGVVLAAARCERTGVPYERYRESVPEDEPRLTANIRVIDGGGRTQVAFYAGDGIKQLMTDRQGNIWTSYFDESNYWTPNPDGTRSYQFMIGLARWDRDGRSPWMVASDTPDVDWCDCYALNVGRELVRACPYTD